MKLILSHIPGVVIHCFYRYLGRTKPGDDDESFVQGSKILAWPSYSYGTFGYLLSYKGVEKLLAQKPLQKMIPVDEYLAIIFDQHPE